MLFIFLADVINVKETIFIIIGGLGIFIFGIYLMGESLKKIAGSKLRLIIEKTTDTPLKGVLTGIVLTAILQSSSATTAIVVGLIGAGLMNLRQGISVIMGSNIGTTVTAFIIGLNISEYALPIVGISACFVFLSNRKKIVQIGSAFLGFGLLFFGLDLMGEQLKTVSQLPFFQEFMQTLSTNSILGVLVGAGITAVIQSSSAAIGILQKIYSTGAMELVVAIPILLGSNIGTTITAVLSSLGSSREGKRAALAHVLFNVLGTILFIIFLNPFQSLMHWIETSFISSYSMTTIAVAHILFNLITTVIMFFFISYLAKLVEKIIPLDEKDALLSSFDKLNYDLIEEAPILAIENARKLIIDMTGIVRGMVTDAGIYINEKNHKVFDEVYQLEDVIDAYDNKIHDYLVGIADHPLGDKGNKLRAICLDTIRDLERIADHAVNLVEYMEDVYDNNLVFSEELMTMINHLYGLVSEMVDDAFIAFTDNDKKAARRVRATEPQIDELEKRYRREQLRLGATAGITFVELHFVDILANLERIGDHANNIADNILFESIHNLPADAPEGKV